MTILRGMVERGKALARHYGFPTANIRIDGQFSGCQGTYAAEVLIDDEAYPAAVYCSRRGEGLVCEAHVLDGHHELYDRQIQVRLIEFIEPVQPFRGELAMRKKIEHDVQRVKQFFKTYVHGNHS